MNKYAQDKMFISRKSQNVKFDRSKINTYLSIYLFHTISCILTKINLPFRKNLILHFKFSPFGTNHFLPIIYLYLKVPFQ